MIKGLPLCAYSMNPMLLPWRTTQKGALSYLIPAGSINVFPQAVWSPKDSAGLWRPKFSYFLYSLCDQNKMKSPSQ